MSNYINEEDPINTIGDNNVDENNVDEDNVNNVNENNVEDEIGEDEIGDDETDDDEVEEMLGDLEPGLHAVYHQTHTGGGKNVKHYADEKMICPYLLGAFVNGELSIEQVAKLKDESSRRKLFRQLL